MYEVSWNNVLKWERPSDDDHEVSERGSEESSSPILRPSTSNKPIGRKRNYAGRTIDHFLLSDKPLKRKQHTQSGWLEEHGSLLGDISQVFHDEDRSRERKVRPGRKTDRRRVVVKRSNTVSLKPSSSPSHTAAATTRLLKRSASTIVGTRNEATLVKKGKKISPHQPLSTPPLKKTRLQQEGIGVKHEQGKKDREETTTKKFDKWGFLLLDDNSSEDAMIFSQSQNTHEWKQLLHEWSGNESNFGRASELLSRDASLPHHGALRQQFWLRFSRANEIAARYPRDHYAVLSSQSSEHESSIELDITRSFPDHCLFMTPVGQRQLFSVLKAYSLFNPHIGYCQGMSYFVGGLLMHLDPEDAFWITAAVIEHHLSGFYEKKFPDVFKTIRLFTILAQRECPAIHAHFETHGISYIFFLVPWYLSLFTQMKNWDIVIAIWDRFFLNGINVIHEVALTILKIFEHEILDLDGIDLLLPFLLSIPSEKLTVSNLFHNSPLSEHFPQLLSESLALVEIPEDTTTSTHSNEQPSVPTPLRKRKRVLEVDDEKGTPRKRPTFFNRLIDSFSTPKKVFSKKTPPPPSLPPPSERRSSPQTPQPSTPQDPLTPDTILGNKFSPSSCIRSPLSPEELGSYDKTRTLFGLFSKKGFLEKAKQNYINFSTPVKSKKRWEIQNRGNQKDDPPNTEKIVQLSTTINIKKRLF